MFEALNSDLNLSQILTWKHFIAYSNKKLVINNTLLLSKKEINFIYILIFGSTLYSEFQDGFDSDIFIILSSISKLFIFFSTKLFEKLYIINRSQIRNQKLLNFINTSLFLLETNFNEINCDIQILSSSLPFVKASVHKNIFVKLGINFQKIIDQSNNKYLRRMNSIRTTCNIRNLTPNYLILKDITLRIKSNFIINSCYKNYYNFIGGISFQLLTSKFIMRLYHINSYIILFYTIKYILVKSIKFGISQSETYHRYFSKKSIKKYNRSLKHQFPICSLSKYYFNTSYNMKVNQFVYTILLFKLFSSYVFNHGVFECKPFLSFFNNNQNLYKQLYKCNLNLMDSKIYRQFIKKPRRFFKIIPSNISIKRHTDSFIILLNLDCTFYNFVHYYTILKLTHKSTKYISNFSGILFYFQINEIYL